MTPDILKPHIKDLGSFTVRRVLPAAMHKMVGPFIFFDHIGPAVLGPGVGMDVRPHPHIGLATVTYLFEGSGLHRDSLGSVQRIDPGDVNWMVAGRGIVHSERTPPEDLARERTLHGIQIWIALPQAHEVTSPSFTHHGRDTLPVITRPGSVTRLIAGSLEGHQAPAAVFSNMFYAHCAIDAGAQFVLDDVHSQRAVYAIDHPITVAGVTIEPGQMAVLPEGGAIAIDCSAAAQVMLLGGDAMDGDRHLNWNFVASTREAIDHARASWQSYPNEQFPPVPGDAEFIPLPASS